MIKKLLTVLLLFFTSAYGESTILCVGDSITEGAGSFKVYRYPLNEMLKKAGFKFSFVGSKSRAQDGVTLKHNGYGGKNTKYLRDNIEEFYKANPAEFVLIHSGHNSFAKDKPVKGIVRNTAKMIETIHKINPQAIILVAQVITAGKLPKYSYIPELNKELGKLSSRRNVVVVDMATGFEWEKDTVGDKVHPNKNGAQKMAKKWFEALGLFKDKF
ncbi:MAG: GDSL-type esterase/lipase family protein [Lentisphaeraceae bacterium]|nr:GDSL-type esterase/lipase family protein [Lentisphaeraceae bacterium]